MRFQTDFEGFSSRIEVQRRYSEFQTLLKVLTQKGVKLPVLSRYRWIPHSRSRWEELNDFGERLSEVSLLFNKVRGLGNCREPY